MMKLLSVNVSLPKEIPYKAKTVTTGIFKESVNGRVMLKSLNLVGDGQADLVRHGGIYKAVYVYSIENFEYWKNELGRNDFTYGQFGENFTVEGMLEDAIFIGDIYRVGDTLVEVTQPRVPCFKLGIKMDMPKFLELYLASARVGFYLRVLEEGEIGAGDVFDRVKVNLERLSVREINHLLYFDQGNLPGVRKALRIKALSPGWRGAFEEILAKSSKEPSESVDCCSGR